MNQHIPHPDECATADEALAAARQARVMAAAIARREAYERGTADTVPCGTARTLVGAIGDAGRTRGIPVQPLPPDPATHRGAAPQQAGTRRKWHILHARGDELVARANHLRQEARTMTPAPNSTEEALAARIADLEERLTIRQAAQAADARANAQRANSLTAPAYDQVIRVGDEAGQYRADDARLGRPSYLQDLYRSQRLGDPQAAERLARHGREVEARGLVQRDSTSANVSGFVPPQYLSDLFAELARAGRPVADLCTGLPLPKRGLTIDVPRITTGATTGAQNGENTALTESTPDDALLAVPVCTIGGFVDISRQAIERGVLVEEVILADLAASYNAELDRQVIAAAGANGEHTGFLNTANVNAITYTDASPTLVALWPKLADAVGKVVSTSYRGPSAILMAPSTWAWALSGLDTANRPLIAPSANGPTNAAGVNGAPGYGSEVGRIMGLPVYLDGNLPSTLGVGGNQTPIVVAAWDEHILMEDGPTQIRADQPGAGNLMSKLVLYGFSAWTAGRVPAATSVILGTGCIVPAL